MVCEICGEKYKKYEECPLCKITIGPCGHPDAEARRRWILQVINKVVDERVGKEVK